MVQALASGGPGSLDGVMMTEGGPKLRSAASLLPAFQIDPAQVRLLGTANMDDPTLGTEPALVGGWYAAPDPGARREFEQRFESVYGRRPPRLAVEVARRRLDGRRHQMPHGGVLEEVVLPVEEIDGRERAVLQRLAEGARGQGGHGEEGNGAESGGHA